MSVDASFTPEKITLLNKNAEIRLKLCLWAKFRPATPSSRVGAWGCHHVNGVAPPYCITFNILKVDLTSKNIHYTAYL